MKRFLLIAAVVLAALIVTLLAVITIAANSSSVHQYAVSRVNEFIPGTLKLDRIHISPLGIQVEILNFTLLDPEGEELASFERFFADVSPWALIGRKLLVRKAVLENPRALVQTDSSGNLTLLSAFPQGDPKPEDTLPAPRNGALIPIQLRSLDIVGGTIYFVSRRDSLEVQTFGLAVAASAETGSMSADLAVSFDSLALKQAATNLRLFDLQLLARVRNLDIDSLHLQLGTERSTLALSGRASSRTDNPLVNLNLTSDLSLSELKDLAALKENLTGTTRVEVNVSGLVSNPDVNLNVSYGGGTIWGYPVRAAELGALLEDRILRLSPLSIRAPAGAVDAAGTIDFRGVFPDGLLEPMGSLQNLRYSMDVTGKNMRLQSVAPELSGALEAELKLEGHGAAPDSLSVKSTLSAKAASLKLSPHTLPLDAYVNISAALEKGTAQIANFSGRIGDAALTLTGGYSLSTGSMDADLDLSVPSLQTMFLFAGLKDSTSGSASLSAQLTGDLKDPQGEVNLTARSLAMSGMQIDSVKLSGLLEKGGIARINRLSIDRLNSAIEVTGSARLMRNGTVVPVESMVIDLTMLSGNINVEDFIDSIFGKVALDARVQGTIGDPEGYARVSASDLSSAGQSISGIDLSARFTNKRANIDQLKIAVVPGQELVISGWAALADSFDITLTASDLDLNELEPLTGVGTLHGALSLAFRAGGTYSQPHADGSVDIRSVRVDSRTVDDIALFLELRDQQVSLSGTAVGDIRATYDLGSRNFSADVQIDDLLLDPYLAISGQALEGTVTASIRASGNTDSISGISATADILNLNIGYRGKRVIETEGLLVSVQNNRYSVPEFSIALAGDGSFAGHAQGSLAGPHDVVLTGTLPLTIVNYFTEQLPDSRGSVDLDLSFRGMPDAPDLKGEVRLRDVSVTLPGLYQRLHSFNGRIIADNRSVRIESVRGNIDNGSFAVSGEMKLEKFTPTDLSGRIDLRTLPVSVPDMVDLVVDAQIDFAGNADTSRVFGDIVLLDGIFYQDIAINPLANIGQARRRETASAPPQIETPYLRNMVLDIGIQARAPFRVNNNLADLTIAPDLQLMGTLAAPALNGRADVQQGTVTYLRKEFEVKRGLIEFVNPYAIEPRVDIQGVIPVDERVLELEISGTLDDLVFKLGSNDPTLEDQDILSLLVLGRTIGELQDNFLPGASGSGGQTNQQLLASLIASTFSDDIREATGLDILEVETGDESDEDSDRIAVTMGKQFTRQLATRYTVESEDGEVVQRAAAEYRVLQNILVEAFQDTRGIFGGALKLFWERR